jgi:hypothetical protein
MKNYHEDLTEHDRKSFKSCEDQQHEFFHASRATGTDLLIPYTATLRSLRYAVGFLLNDANSLFLIGRTNSGEIEEVGREEFESRLCSALKRYCEESAHNELLELEKRLGFMLDSEEREEYVKAKRDQYFKQIDF